MRKTCNKIKVDAEYRWFLNIPFGQETPHFSTFSKNYERRFKVTDSIYYTNYEMGNSKSYWGNYFKGIVQKYRSDINVRGV